MRIAVFSEHLRAPYDEGIKKVAIELARALASGHEVLTLTSQGADDLERQIQNVESNRLLLSPRLQAIMRHFQPQVIFYVPTACGTAFSFVRAWVLRSYGRTAPTALVTLQPRAHSTLGQWCIRSLAPDWVLTQSRTSVAAFAELGCRAALLQPAVDVERFRPSANADKAALRARYGIPVAARVACHVGHLNAHRNLSPLLELQCDSQYHVLVVASTSTPQDQIVKQAFLAGGATVFDTYLPAIEDIYHLSDVFLFLADEENAAIEVPLSVMEAMACNLPVVTTRFGGLMDWFPEGSGLAYLAPASDRDGGKRRLTDAVEAVLSVPCTTRTLVEARTWTAAARAALTLMRTSRMGT